MARKATATSIQRLPSATELYINCILLYIYFIFALQIYICDSYKHRQYCQLYGILFSLYYLYYIPSSWLAPFVHVFCVITLLTAQLESFNFFRNIIFLARHLLIRTRAIKLLWDKRNLTRSRCPGVTNLREQRRSRSVMIMSLRP